MCEGGREGGRLCVCVVCYLSVLRTRPACPIMPIIIMPSTYCFLQYCPVMLMGYNGVWGISPQNVERSGVCMCVYLSL